MRIRVAGVLIQENTMLLVEHRKEGNNYWLLPGGGVRTGEKMDRALKRELLEELHLHIEVGDLLFVVETIAANKTHIIQPTYRISCSEEETPEIGKDIRVVGYRFYDADGIQNIRIYPDIRGELHTFLTSRTVQKRYIFKQWID